MKTSLMIVSYRKDFSYLEWALKSIHKYCSGFHELQILVPTGQRDEVMAMKYAPMIHDKVMPVRVREYDEWPEKGMLHHQAQIMKADIWCHDADYIAHTDSDCIFTDNVTPDTYIEDGKPYLRYEPYINLGVRHPGAGVWQAVVQDCLPFMVDNEYMRTHPGVHHRVVYPKTREVMEQHTRREFDEYMRSGRNQFPQDRCEFNTLGSVAAHYFPDKYKLVRQFGDRVTPDPKILQAWGHGPIDRPQRIWFQGCEEEIVPLETFKAMLGEF